MSVIYTDCNGKPLNRAETSNKVNRPLVRKSINNHFKAKNKRSSRASELFQRLVMDTMSLVVDPQIKDGEFRMDVSDDHMIAILGCSAAQAKRIRSTLKDIGIMWFPEYSRPKKKGDYPLWMVKWEFIVFTKVDKPAKKKRSRANSKYTQQYWDFYETAKTEIREANKALDELRKSECEANGTTYTDTKVDMRNHMMNIYTALDELLHEANLTKADLLA